RYGYIPSLHSFPTRRSSDLPNFTVNLGLRYDLQFPFTPLNSSYSTATIADLCGISGVGSDGRCNLFQPGLTPGKRPEFVQFGERSEEHTSELQSRENLVCRL